MWHKSVVDQPLTAVVPNWTGLLMLGLFGLALSMDNNMKNMVFIDEDAADDQALGQPMGERLVPLKRLSLRSTSQWRIPIIRALPHSPLSTL